jgi:DNA-binding MarR family transcriptional regulator
MPEVAALQHEIGQLYENIVNIAMRAGDGEQPMTGTQRMALIEVVRNGPLRARDIAAQLATTRATATRAVDGLVERAYVQRRASPEDRRGVLICSTPRGRRWVQKRETLLRAELLQLPTTVVSKRLIQDLATLNKALRARIDGGDVQSAHPMAR